MVTQMNSAQYNAMFDALDANHDGTVSRAELERAMLQRCVAAAPPASWPCIGMGMAPFPVTSSQTFVTQASPRSQPVVGSQFVSRAVYPTFEGGRPLESRVVPQTEIILAPSVVHERPRAVEAPVFVERTRQVDMDEAVSHIRSIVQQVIAEWEAKHDQALFSHVRASTSTASDELKDFTATLIEERMREVSKSFEEWNAVLKGFQSNLDWQHSQLEVMRKQPTERVRDEEVHSRLMDMEAHLQTTAQHAHIEALSRDISFLSQRQAQVQDMASTAPQAQGVLQAVQDMSRVCDDLRQAQNIAQADIAALAREIDDLRANAGRPVQEGSLFASGGMTGLEKEDFTRAMHHLRDRVEGLEASVRPEQASQLRNIEDLLRYAEVLHEKAPSQELGARVELLEHHKADKDNTVPREAVKALAKRMEGLHQDIHSHINNHDRHAPSQSRGLAPAFAPALSLPRREGAYAAAVEEEEGVWDTLFGGGSIEDYWKLHLDGHDGKDGLPRDDQQSEPSGEQDEYREHPDSKTFFGRLFGK